MSVACLDSAARTAISQDGVSDELLSGGSACFRSTLVRTRSLTVSYYNKRLSLMRFLLSLTAGALLLCSSAQSADVHDAEDAAVARARLDIEKMRALVEAGALPRAQLERAEDALGDAQDMAVSSMEKCMWDSR